MSPKVPKYTCPAIDRTLGVIKEAKHWLAEIEQQDESILSHGERARIVSDLLIPLPGELEDLRAANDQLRQAYEYWKEKADELESLNEELRRATD